MIRIAGSTIMASNQLKRRRHRRSFGAIRQLASGNYQASFKDLDGSNQVAPQKPPKPNTSSAPFC